MKKTILIILIIAGFIFIGFLGLQHKRNNGTSIWDDYSNKYVGKITTNVIHEGYVEHAFDLPSSQDIHTRLTLEKIVSSNKSLVKNAQPISLPEWEYIEQNPPLAWSETWKVNNDVYDFNPTTKTSQTPTEFSVSKNKQKVFSFKGEYGAEGPIIQKVIINDKPGFTLRTAYDANSLHSKYDIYYDGKFLSEPEKGSDTSVNNPHYLFSYDGKIGFINDGGEHGASIIFDNHYITDNFDEIHFQNCCEIQQLLPTVYDNGILVFYAKRQNQNYIVEVDLKKNRRTKMIRRLSS